MKKAIILLFSLGLLHACSGPNDSGESSSVGFWDHYFAEAFQKLGQQKAGLKRVDLNGEIEEQEIQQDSAAWAKELSFFTKNNLDKPSWQGWFTIDSTFHGDTLIIQYQRTKSKIPVQYAMVKQFEGEVNYYERLLERSNPISGLQRRLIFQYPHRIEIDNVEKLLFLSDHHLNIVYEWD